jgi:hypothetical protein
MSESIFDGETPPAVPAVPATPVTPALQVPPELADLVGEGKKYASVELALKSVAPAQRHIETIEQENARLKAELENNKTTAELLEELRGNGLGEQRQPAKQELPDVEKIVEQALERKQAQTVAKQNTAKVISAFQETFGDKAKAEEVYIKLAAENGMSVAMLNALSANSPDAVLKLAGISKKQESVPAGKPSGTVNTQALNQTQSDQPSAKINMVGASSKEVTAAWRAARDIVNKKLNQG